VNALMRFWRWLTLADTPVHRPWPPVNECDFCAEPVTCHVNVNERTWQTCVAHMNEPLEGVLRDRAVPPAS
jgi:hypothetical protein